MAIRLEFHFKMNFIESDPMFLYFISLIMKKANQCYQKFNVREYSIEHWHIWISEWLACGFYGRVFASHSLLALSVGG